MKITTMITSMIIFLSLSMPLFAKSANPLMIHHTVTKKSQKIFEVVNTVFDNKTLQVEIRQYKNRSAYQVVSTVNVEILKSEMQVIADFLIFLADAPLTEKNRLQRCTIQPNNLTSRYMATVRDFDPATRKFYGKIQTVDNDSKCWQAAIIEYSYTEDRYVATQLKNYVNKIADIVTAGFISGDSH